MTDSGVQRQASSQALAKALKDFKGIAEFAEPLLLEAMRKEFVLAPDVNKTMLYHMRNRYGRRDNKYKARIKILVKALTPEVFAERVQSKWAASR